MILSKKEYFGIARCLYRYVAPILLTRAANYLFNMESNDIIFEFISSTKIQQTETNYEFEAVCDLYLTVKR